MSDMPPIEVTVLVVTYNHERFIEHALQSVLDQETTFDYEVLVSEDCSTDRTQALVSRVAERHPQRVRLLLSHRNLNDNGVLRRGVEAARGRYIALLDGDDLWTRSDKLQRQVEFLAEHSECAVCFHKAMFVDEEGESLGLHMPPEGQEPLSGVDDLLQSNFVPTCSAMIRAAALHEMPPWYDGALFGDWPLLVLAARHGLIGYIDEVMAAYRVHDLGAWSGVERQAQLEMDAKFLRRLNVDLGFRYDAAIREALAGRYVEVASLSEKEGNRKRARAYLGRALRVRGLRASASDRDIWKLSLKLSLPLLAQAVRRRRRKATPAAPSR
jgi:glycosyltransferase involved in cell wall biosynthesis